MAGKFEIYKDRGGKHRFRLKAGNGEIILTSQGYSAKRGCANGIESVRKNAASAANFEKKESGSNKFMFNLKAANKQVIGTSQSYTSSSGRDNGIRSVQRSAPGAKVVEA
ncbi:MAG: YegP family protein [Gammaproteobacteria bacterium]|nr:YegP family protein [Gammaproteobacteria bacterium]MDH3858604.1 YegP family protein [Gammaproteobacteria bacterium]